MFFEYFNKKWKELYQICKYLTIDESMCSYKGKIIFSQYMKDKHRKIGMKFFTKSSSDNGYVYQILPYSGKSFKYNKNIGIGPSIIIEFTKEHKNKSFHFTSDNFHSNPYIFLFLEKNSIDFICIFSRNRKGIPKIINNLELDMGQKRFYQIENTNIRFLIYNDKKQIQIASNSFSYYLKKYKNKKNKYKCKREMIAYYNLTKSGWI